jgi:hypothetical protein
MTSPESTTAGTDFTGAGGTAAVGGNTAVQMYGDQFGLTRLLAAVETTTTTGTTTPGTLPTGLTTTPSQLNLGALLPMANFSTMAQMMAASHAPTFVALSNPAGGGVVGLTKISDGNSPLPRDRVIFDYDYFSRVPLTDNGIPVNRFSPGFEKTFCDQRASLEVRVPFASTLSSNIQAEGVGNTNRAELGDVHLTLKGLVIRGETCNVAAGLGIDLPTADDVHVLGADGTTLLRVRNDAVLLTPYVAYLWTPCDRLWLQNWAQFVFDANSDQVQANVDGSGLAPVGHLYQQSLAEVDAQLGYWVCQNRGGGALLNGLAPFVELHYNATMNSAQSVENGNFGVGFGRGGFNELNITAGLLIHACDHVILGVGAAAPLLGHDERTFDYQVGIRGSILFGPTARNVSRATTPSSF